ncbi:uncharacterized protein BXZ73DRAFT_38973 [Epithele typhae]|uniref:uncharacterized protein n=1 Tax=Epithele typhae TaxID=378194 RepID=UPI0020081364|nr:uncharacterized protein BXZ73DRAFT_38973 [Epithele typhae]KAH9945180.1 hypothetical protein BXZ73DRAFT_38973 [Epithele typhae]
MNPFALVHHQLRRSFTSPPRCAQPVALARRAHTPPSITTTLARRHFSEKPRSAPEAADAAPKPKPKASTPLRRSASASLPIRANPTPTRSEIHPVTTLATAERYAMGHLLAALPEGAVLLHDAWWVPRWRPAAAAGESGSGGREGEVFVFGNGSFVCWGLDEEGARAFLREVVWPARAEVARLKEPETEDLEFVTDPQEETRLQGDLIILGKLPPLNTEASLPASIPPSALPQDTLLVRYAYSQALSRSTALSGLETSLEHYLSSIANLPRALQKTGKPGLGRKQLVMKLGELLRFRQGLNLNRENFSDTPDFYWSEPVLEGYFNTLSNALEMRARIRSVNDKITYAAEASNPSELLTETSAHRMELIIIALIAVEVVICLIRDGPELWHMVFGEDEKSTKTTETDA